MGALKKGRGRARDVYKYISTPHNQTLTSSAFMDDFGTLHNAPGLAGASSITIPAQKQIITYTIGRTAYTIGATAQAIDKLRAKILAKKRWFADKLLSKKTLNVSDKAAQDVAQVVASAQAMAAIEQASESSALQALASEASDTSTEQAASQAEDVQKLATVCEQAQHASQQAPGAPGGNMGHAGTVNTSIARQVASSARAQAITSKSGAWNASFFAGDDGRPCLIFNGGQVQVFETGSERMRALQAMARAADAPSDTPPALPSPADSEPPVMEFLPEPPVAVSSVPLHPRNFIPDDGLHIVDDSFEAWKYQRGERFGFVMYLGKSAKPWKYYGYPTEAKRDAGFTYYADDARSIAASKAKRKVDTKARIDKGHGLQVGDIVRSSWGYDQTNVEHYQITKIIGKRTVEVRQIAEHDEATGDMTGRCAPVPDDFVGEPMRRQVDAYGEVNIRRASFGRAYKIEPLTVVHGVRCYAATGYSSYA
jgi:hypothetical protein